ncbi:MAG: DeoR/GlpR family DNA-binding transcription regulator [Thermoleophilia bacterium]
MRQEERFSWILHELAESGTVAIAELAPRLGVSKASVRRDLELLEERHLLKRTHGGATASGLLLDLPLRYGSGSHRAVKQRIAVVAAGRVNGGVSVVGFTGGTTTTEVARALADRPGLTIVTNALNIASELALRRNLKLFVTGGVARAESYELLGPLAEAALHGFNLDVVFVGVNGIGVRGGVTTNQEDEAHTMAVLLDHAQSVIVVTESAKIGKVTFARICDIQKVDELITDVDADRAELDAIEAAGVRVTLV